MCLALGEQAGTNDGARGWLQKRYVGDRSCINFSRAGRYVVPYRFSAPVVRVSRYSKTHLPVDFKGPVI